MAMTAKEAAQVVKKGNMGAYDVKELYDALVSEGQYNDDLTKLLDWMDKTANQGVVELSHISEAAKAINQLHDSTNPLDEKNAEYADVRAKLKDIEFTDVVTDDKGGNAEAVVKNQKEVLGRVVEAAKLNTMTQLRGLSSAETGESKKFLNAKNIDERRKIYHEVLKTAINDALLEIAVGGHGAEIYHKMLEECKTGAEGVAKAKEFAKKQNDDVQKQYNAWERLGTRNATLLQLRMDLAVAYCAAAEVVAAEALDEYKASFDKRMHDVSGKMAKLLERDTKKSKQLNNKWNNSKAKIETTVAGCNEKVETETIGFGAKCKKMWDNRYEYAKTAWKNTVKYVKENKGVLGADIGAAAVYAGALTAATATGVGAIAVAGGAAYGIYTFGRRVIYERNKRAKEKEAGKIDKIWDAKFVTKAIFATGAAVAAGWGGFAVGAASSGITNASAQLLASKLARRGATMGGSMISNTVGVLTAGNKEERMKELKTLGVSTLVAGAVVGSGYFYEMFRDNNSDVVDRLGTYKPTASVTPEVVGTTEAVAAEPVAETTLDYDFGGFPDEYNSDMGITRAQFDNMRNIIMKNSDGTTDLLDRMHFNAGNIADSVSLDGEQLTPEQVMFKFLRAGAWTTKMGSDGWSFAESGIFAKELGALNGALGCGDVLSAEEAHRIALVLDSVRANGSLDAEKVFDLVPGAERFNEVAPDGSILGTTNNRLVGAALSNDLCAEDKELEFIRGATPEKVAEEVVEQVAKAPAEVPTIEVKSEFVEIARPETRIEVDMDFTPENFEINVPEAPEEVAFSSSANLSATSGQEGVDKINALQQDGSNNIHPRINRHMLNEVEKSGENIGHAREALERDIRAGRTMRGGGRR